ncbi:GFA family protein [Ensifer soli]|uniref:GFA family protein n=1 Tax=Ciceribacter sp. sgz301302 TaxID=3342379 RepID=UPI0035B7BC24
MLSRRCHCGDTVFEVDGDLPAALTRCTCSFCSKAGVLRAYYRPEQLRLTGTAAHDRIYRWQSGLLAHHFCGRCGCTTFTDSPAFEMDGSWDGATRQVSINARLVDGIEAADLPVEVIDGKTLW